MPPQDVPDSTHRSVIVALFDREAGARDAIDAVRSLGLSDEQLGLLTPAQRLSVSETTTADISTLLALAANSTATGAANDVANVLQSMGVPDGEARFYA